MFTTEVEFSPHFFGWHSVLIEELTQAQWQTIQERVTRKVANRQVAQRDIRSITSSTSAESTGGFGATLDPDLERLEGAIYVALRRHFARDAQLRREKIRQVMREHGRLMCEVLGCGFDFEEIYGT